MNIDTAKLIAKRKGLVLTFNSEDNAYILSDRTGTALMNYATITLEKITEQRWRSECNIMRNNH